MIKYNDFAERYADVITVTKNCLTYVEDYYQIRQDVQDDLLDIWNHYDCRT